MKIILMNDQNRYQKSIMSGFWTYRQTTGPMHITQSSFQFSRHNNENLFTGCMFIKYIEHDEIRKRPCANFNSNLYSWRQTNLTLPRVLGVQRIINSALLYTVHVFIWVFLVHPLIAHRKQISQLRTSCKWKLY